VRCCVPTRGVLADRFVVAMKTPYLVASAGTTFLLAPCDATEGSNSGANGPRGPVKLLQTLALSTAIYCAVFALAERARKEWPASCVVVRFLSVPNDLRRYTSCGVLQPGRPIHDVIADRHA